MTTVMLSPEEVLQRFEAGRKQLASLTTRAAALGGQVAAAKSQLAELAPEAEALYGSANLDQLRATFIAWQTENTATVLAFEKELAATNVALTEVETAVRVATTQ